MATFCSTNPFPYEDEEEAFAMINSHNNQFSGASLITLPVLMSVMVSVIVFGNALVILVFVLEKSLRNHSNYFLFNLAICDFCVGAFSIPLYIPYVLTGQWLLGRVTCKLWLSIDTVLCVTSICTIVLISYDRFLSITKAVEFRMQQNNARIALKKMLFAWMFSFTVYCPPIIFWEYIIGKSTVPPDACFYEFNNTWDFLLPFSLSSLVIPAVLVSYFNITICWRIRIGSKSQQSILFQGVNQVPSKARKKLTNSIFFVKPQQIPENAEGSSTSSQPRQQNSISILTHIPSLPLDEEHTKHTNGKESNLRNDATSKSVGSNSNSRLSKDVKIAKSLSIIVCIFAICWTPYSILMVIRAACHEYIVNRLESILIGRYIKFIIKLKIET
ncbi:histamine H3 receptor-like [Microcaecilia unicolor]|uniref:Histamine H3 receptor-like n=1 Tax=Microcaecilia unicolor TaxID=1415580 RepID=A0A6P7X2J1_9AMPH|nr:histamine H3 receptor-like [Microcaecilia unicolor]